jgi:glycine/serine hydroxymethyltransferase
MEKWAQRVGWPKKAPLSRGQKLQEAETTLTTSGSISLRNNDPYDPSLVKSASGIRIGSVDTATSAPQ